MLKVIKGYIRVSSEMEMERLCEILTSDENRKDLTLEEVQADFIEIDNFSPKMMDKLKDEGFLTEEELQETPELDQIKFYLD